jgi:hypothetical protein
MGPVKVRHIVTFDGAEAADQVAKPSTANPV